MDYILLDPKLCSKVLRFIQIQIHNCFNKITKQINPHLMILLLTAQVELSINHLPLFVFLNTTA